MSKRAADPFWALLALAFRNTRILTVAFAYAFAVYAFIQPTGYRRSYPTRASRDAFAGALGHNSGLRLLYGQPHDLMTIGGYSAWRIGGVLSIAAAAFGVLAAVRGLRAEEDSGRMEIVLAGMVSRRKANVATVSAIVAGVVLLWLAQFAGFLIARLPAGGSAYLALSTSAVALVFVGVGALASQLASTRRAALGMSSAVIALMFVARVVADTVAGAGWVRWTTPLGWAELMRPFADVRPLVLLLPIASSVLLLACSARLAVGRDLGAGALPARNVADPKLRLLRSPIRLSLRDQLPTLAVWAGCSVVLNFILGVVSRSISRADIPRTVQGTIAKLGVGSIATPAGYLAFVFHFVVVAVCALMCAQVGAARNEEAGQRLEMILALPVARAHWLVGRLVIGLLAAAAVSLGAAFSAWAGSATAGVHVSGLKMFEAGVNILPLALLFLGVAALAYAVVPRAGGVAYGVLIITFLWQLIGSLLDPPHWLLELTPFAHIGLLPAEPFDAAAAAALAAVGMLACVVAVYVFGRRDLVGE